MTVDNRYCRAVSHTRPSVRARLGRAAPSAPHAESRDPRSRGLVENEEKATTSHDIEDHPFTPRQPLQDGESCCRRFRYPECDFRMSPSLSPTPTPKTCRFRDFEKIPISAHRKKKIIPLTRNEFEHCRHVNFVRSSLCMLLMLGFSLSFRSVTPLRRFRPRRAPAPGALTSVSASRTPVRPPRPSRA